MFFKEYKDLNYIKILRPEPWTRERNILATSFLRGATGLQENENSQRKINGFADLLEQLIYVWHILTIYRFQINKNDLPMWL